MEKADIKKLNDSLKHGEQAKIAIIAGVSKPHVNRFLNGNEDSVSEETITKILKAAATVIKNRSKQQKKNEDLLKSI